MDTSDESILGDLPAFGHQEELLALPDTRTQTVRTGVAHPVAHVRLLQVSPHLDHVFDYLIPEELSERARVGHLVRVPFARGRREGFLVSRDADAFDPSHLKPLSTVVSAVPLLSTSVAREAELAAEQLACNVSDLLRDAVPSRHARAEREFLASADGEQESVVSTAESGDDAILDFYSNASSLRSGLSKQETHFFQINRVAGAQGDICPIISALVTDALNAGRGALVVVPTSRRAHALARRLDDVLPGQCTVFTSDQSPELHYRSFLRIVTGESPIVVGTLAAVWAPVERLGAIILVDENSDLMRFRRVPYARVSQIAAIRADVEGASVVSLGLTPSTQMLARIHSNEATLLVGHHALSEAPHVSVPEQWIHTEGDRSRIPSAAFSLVRGALTHGPVLALVPRSGYIPMVVCAQCSRRAQCGVCDGDIGVANRLSGFTCVRCGSDQGRWRCPYCGGHTLRARRFGTHRTAEELGRAFAGVGIIVSDSQAPDGIVDEVSADPRIIVATPGAEPRAEGGFAAGLVFDSRFLFGSRLRSQQSFLDAVARVAARVRSRREGGHVLVMGGAPRHLVSALDQWDMVSPLQQTLDEAMSLKMPPFYVWFAISGRAEDIRTFVALLVLHERVRSSGQAAPTLDAVEHEPLLVGGVHRVSARLALLGPVKASREGEVTVYVRPASPPSEIDQDGTAQWLVHEGHHVARAIRETYRVYSARKAGKPLKIMADPDL
ncbi:MAG: hypothetical protein SPI12_04830 [Actinomycetaceae bacterium]|nr:hypothetical protein [Actinomycetaceae bacterium]MDY6083170.1 hypothetical protein [Actinomycetaceae bacterium]